MNRLPKTIALLKELIKKDDANLQSRTTTDSDIKQVLDEINSIAKENIMLYIALAISLLSTFALLTII